MFFTFPEDARWNAQRQAVEFGVEIGEYRVVVRVRGACSSACYRSGQPRNGASKPTTYNEHGSSGSPSASYVAASWPTTATSRSPGANLREGAAGRLERPSVAQLPSATAIEWTARDLGASKLRRD